jgi:hypothetical protein
VLLFGGDPNDEDGNGRVLAHAKHNLGPLAPSLAYRIETRVLEGYAAAAITTSLLVGDGESAASSADLLTRDEPSARSEARDFLLAELAEGAVLTVELRKRAEDAGIAWRTCERAAKTLGVLSRRGESGWTKELVAPRPPHSLTPHIGGVGGLDHPKTAKDANTATFSGLDDVADLNSGLSRRIRAIAALPGDEQEPAWQALEVEMGLAA